MSGKTVRLQVILVWNRFTGIGKEEISITGAKPKCIFLFSSASAKYASEKNFKCTRNLARP